MKFDPTLPITDLQGKTVPETNADNSPMSTIGQICQQALLATIPGENPSGKEKYDRYQLALKINAECELESEEVVSLKSLIGQCYGPMVVGRAYDILEGK